MRALNHVKARMVRPTTPRNVSGRVANPVRPKGEKQVFRLLQRFNVGAAKAPPTIMSALRGKNDTKFQSIT
jgi:hypothetical protein